MDTLRPSSGRGVSTDHAARSRAETCHIIGAAALSLRGSGSGCRSMAVASLAFRRPGGTASHPLMTRCGRLHLLFQGASCVGKAISALSDPFASVRHRPGATRVGPMSVVFRRPHRGLAIPMPPMAAAIRLGRGVPGQRAGRMHLLTHGDLPQVQGDGAQPRRLVHVVVVPALGRHHPAASAGRRVKLTGPLAVQRLLRRVMVGRDD